MPEKFFDFTAVTPPTSERGKKKSKQIEGREALLDMVADGDQALNEVYRALDVRNEEELGAALRG